MKISNNILAHLLKLILKLTFLVILFVSTSLYAQNLIIEIKGNKFTDELVIESLLEEKPKNISQEYANYIIKTLDKSQLFENVTVNINENKYVILVSEYPNINKIYFENNKRLKDEELLEYSNELKLFNLNPLFINNYIAEIKNLYESFGYNNINISYVADISTSSNTADLFFEIEEGKITKINKIIFNGNEYIDDETLKSIIKSKTKTLINIFANNNFKKFVVDNDIRLLNKFYINKGYLDIKIDLNVEYLKSNKVNIFINISEGNIHNISSIKIQDNQKILNTNISNKINLLITDALADDKLTYSVDEINILKGKISEILINDGIEYFEIKALEKKENLEVTLLYEILPIQPNYTRQINIYGNSRTFDYVIRRELQIAEGDAIYETQLTEIQNKLKSLNIFENIKVEENNISENLVDVDITVEEKQTGSISAGLSIGSIDGLAAVAGLKENNFYGTGRSVEALINTSQNQQQYTLLTTDRLIYENDVDVSYKANYIEQDFSKASSYNLDTFTLGTGLSYMLDTNINHSIALDYNIKNYKITNEDLVAKNIKSSSGENVSFILKNNIFYNTLGSGYLPRDGNQISFSNIIETPTSSSNGYLKNIITIKNFKKLNKNTYSIQTRIGNILSLNNNDILTDDKFSLGGRWLRGFDSFGAGPRNSRSSYIGGNNLIVTKLDYSRNIFDNTDFPILFNIFNDYGLLWENKTKPTHSENSLRSSVGFGLKYYSPIGPIGLTWGFPVLDEDYDIKRMFLFSVGNVD